MVDGEPNRTSWAQQQQQQTTTTTTMEHSKVIVAELLFAVEPRQRRGWNPNHFGSSCGDPTNTLFL
jgi:hypothetical protein